VRGKIYADRVNGPRTLDQLEDRLPVVAIAFPQDSSASFDALVPPGSAVTNFHNGCAWMKQQLSWSRLRSH
jgi:hypothetical protein